MRAHEEFARRFHAWLSASPEAAAALEHLAGLAIEAPITLLTSVSDVEHSHLPLLRRAVAGAVLARLGERLLRRTRRFQAILFAAPQASVSVGCSGRVDELRVIARAIAASGREVEVGDAESEGRSPECYLDSYSFMGLPVAYCGRLVGALVAESEQLGAFSDQDRADIRELGQRVASVLVA